MSLVLSRAEVGPARWNQFVDEHVDGWWWHRAEWLDYCVAYECAEDWSFMLWADDRTPVALCPLIVSQGTRIEGGGAPLGAPLVRQGSVVDEVNQVLLGRARAHEVQHCWYRTCPMCPDYGATLPSRHGWSSQPRWSQVVDLTQSILVLKQQLRKSYRYAIMHPSPDYQIELVKEGTDFWIADMRRLHTEQAGRETRPVKTWTIMGRWMVSGYASAVLVRERQTNGCVGFVFAIHYKNRAYYACGAAQVSTHLLQWEMMQYLKAKGVQQYELGWQQSATDTKGQNIEFFKRGFGGRTAPFTSLEWTGGSDDH